MDNDPTPVQEQKKEKPLNELLTSSVVDIYIGPESTHWPLHERLLCYHSPFLANIFYNEHDKATQSNTNHSSSRKNKSYGFPDEEDQTFTLLVGWLYSRTIPPPSNEKEIGPLLDLYLLSEKLEISCLSTDVVDAVRDFYHSSSTYPGLRRVQYIYSNTSEDNEMREMMVSAVARQLTTTEKVPAHWANALQRNGQLAVDIIRSIQRWHIEEESIPDIRDSSSMSNGRGRKSKGGFSAIEREADSLETDTTGVAGSVSFGSNLGVESLTSEETGQLDEKLSEGGEVEAISDSEILTLSSLSLLQAQLKRRRPRYTTNQVIDASAPTTTLPPLPPPRRHRRRSSASVSFNLKPEIVPVPSEPRPPPAILRSEEQRDTHKIQPHRLRTALAIAFQRPEALLLFSLWVLYLIWFLIWMGIWKPQSN